MKSRIKVQRFIQMTIIFGCVIFLAFQFVVTSSEAQSGCVPNEPPLINPANPRSKSWPLGKTVSVRVFDRSDTEPTSDAEFNAINSGIRDWNSVSVSGCSGVTHANATRTNRGWRGQGLDVPPLDTIYVVRTMDRNGQFLAIELYNQASFRTDLMVCCTAAVARFACAAGAATLAPAFVS